MPRVRLGPKFLELGQRINSTNSQQVLKDFLFWLANTSTDIHYTKRAILDELLRLTTKEEKKGDDNGGEESEKGPVRV